VTGTISVPDEATRRPSAAAGLGDEFSGVGVEDEDAHGWQFRVFIRTVARYGDGKGKSKSM
jgi:hypothetical protein